MKNKLKKKRKEVKSVKNINKNPQSFLMIRPLPKEVANLHKLPAHTYE